MLQPSNFLILLTFLPSLFFSCQINEQPDSDPAPSIAADEVMSFPNPGVSCNLLGTSFKFNLSVTVAPAASPQGLGDNFPYQIDLLTQAFRVGGENTGCPCKVKKYRLYFNSQAAANQVQLYNSLGQALPVPGAQANPSAVPGPWFIELTEAQIAAQFWLRFANQTTPAPLMVHAGGYCIIDNIGGLGSSYLAISPHHAPTMNNETQEEYDEIYFWPDEDAFFVSEIP